MQNVNNILNQNSWNYYYFLWLELEKSEKQGCRNIWKWTARNGECSYISARVATKAKLKSDSLKKNRLHMSRSHASSIKQFWLKNVSFYVRSLTPGPPMFTAIHYTIKLHYAILMWTGGVYSPKFLVGVCGSFLKTRTLFQTKICNFRYPTSQNWYKNQ